MSEGFEIYNPDYDFASMPTEQLQAELKDTRRQLKLASGMNDHFLDNARLTRDRMKAELAKRGIVSP